jgi:hypothetical protein
MSEHVPKTLFVFVRVFSQTGRDQKIAKQMFPPGLRKTVCFLLGLASCLFPARRCRQGTGSLI